jgi:hypothetical protein
MPPSLPHRNPLPEGEGTNSLPQKASQPSPARGGKESEAEIPLRVNAQESNGHKPLLFQDTGLGKGSDLVLRHVKDLLADFYRVLTEERSWMAKLPRCL